MAAASRVEAERINWDQYDVSFAQKSANFEVKTLLKIIITVTCVLVQHHNV